MGDRDAIAAAPLLVGQRRAVAPLGIRVEARVVAPATVPKPAPLRSLRFLRAAGPNVSDFRWPEVSDFRWPLTQSAWR